MADSQRFSRTVRSMLQLRQLLHQFLRCSIRDGLSASFWFDTWTDMGQLFSIFGSSGPRDLRIPRDALVADAVRDGHWQLPPARSDDAVTLQIVLSTMTTPAEANGRDIYLWRSRTGGYDTKFSSRVTWNMIRVRSPPVLWHDTVWFKEEIPRCSFIMWLVFLLRLPTRDRLLSWGLTVPDSCVLCDTGQETHHHLFFDCPFAITVWSFFCGRFLASPPQDPSDMVRIIQEFQGEHASQVIIIYKLLLQVIVYHLWRERNARIFRDTAMSPHALFKMIDRSLRDRLLSVVRVPTSTHSLLQLYFWFVDPYS
ncbi:hypothetical protein N665_5041s0002 [Sinapis alba]|nr:hypothetical protein N665_5041s0002 [Sinapis alba]